MALIRTEPADATPTPDASLCCIPVQIPFEAAVSGDGPSQPPTAIAAILAETADTLPTRLRRQRAR